MSTDSIYPKIRFPEFRDLESWSTIKLEDCLLQAPDYGLNAPAVPYSDKLPTYLRITDIADDGTFISENKMSVNAELNENNSLHDGDIVFARTGASVGKAYKYRTKDGALIFAGFLIRIRPNQQILRSEYIYQYLFTSSYKNWVQITSTRSGQPGINSKEYSSLLVPHTSPTEQQKIADCLSSLDKYIDATKRKLELLKEHKKGLMQRLFPAKGKTTPELRFPEFQNDGEWVEVPFGSIINVNSGKDYKHLDVGNIPVYGTGGYMLSVNDRLSDIDAVGIGRKGTIDKPQYLKAPFWTVDTLFFLTSSKNYDIRYLYYLCQTIPWKTYGEQTGVPSISKNSIDKLDVVITTNLVEQQKIAQSLLHLDNAMDAIKRKIHLLETHKYGLMQNLFPNLNNY